MRILLYIAFFLLVLSCNPTSNNKELSKQGTSISNSRTNKMANMLNLPPLTKGADSFELRVWVTSGMIDPDYVTILRYSDSLWHLTETTYWTGHTEDWLYFVDSSITKRLPLSASIQSVIDSINVFGLDTFPTQEHVPGFDDRTADGFAYTIEIATKDRNNAIVYRNPQYYNDGYHKTVVAFLLFLNRTVGLPTPALNEKGG